MRPSVRISLLVLAFAGLARAQDGALTLDDIVGLLELKTDEREILRLVRKADSVALPDGFERALKDRASETLIAALRDAADADVIGEVLRRVAAGQKDPEVIQWIGEKGRRRALTAEERMRLARGGATAKMILAIEGRLVLTGYQEYREDLGMFSIQHPADWKVTREYAEAGVVVVLAPREPKAANQFTTGVQIQIRHLEKGSFGVGEAGDLRAWVRRSLPGFLRLNRPYEMAPVEGDAGRADWTFMRGLRAVSQDLHVTMQGVKCRETLVRFNYEDLHYFVELVAPRDQFQALHETFKRMRLSLCPYPGRFLAGRRRVKLEPNEALDLYREAVVLVDTAAGSGSGFFVRPDGWVLTNHHVVCAQPAHIDCDNAANHRTGGTIKLVWDEKAYPGRQGERRREVEAELIDTHYSLSPRIDLALLKVKDPQLRFPVIPVAPIASGLIHEGDPVVALGFPFPSLHGYGNLFLTSGAINRFNYIEHPLRSRDRRDLDFLFTDAEINAGNSGGPCVDLVTGTVIGLNTFANPDPQNEARELLYAGVVAIDHALDHFPQIRWYPPGKSLDAVQHLELGAMFLARRYYRAAARELGMAAIMGESLSAEQKGRLYMCRYRLEMETGGDAAPYLGLALMENPRNRLALLALAEAKARAGDKQALVEIAKVVQSYPDDWKVRLRQADICRRLGQLPAAEEALKAAFQLAGADEPHLQRMKGRLCYLRNQWDDGLQACRKAVGLDSADEEAVLALADGLEKKGDPAGAMRECIEMVERNPEAALVHARIGRTLMADAARKDDAFGRLSLALGLMTDRNEQPEKDFLRFVCAKAAEHANAPELNAAALHELCFTAAATLHKEAPAEAHGLLAKLWTRLGAANLEKIHAHLAGTGGADRIEPLSFPEAGLLLTLKCPPRLLDEILGATSIGFNFTSDLVKSWAKANLKFLLALMRRREEDQLAATSSLKAFVTTEWMGFAKPPAGPAARRDLKIKNTGPYPLTDIAVQLTYPDPPNLPKALPPVPLDLEDPVLLPGEERTVEFTQPAWTELDRLGVKRVAVPSCQVRAASARNAAFLGDLAFAGEMTKDGCVCEVANRSGFVVTDLIVRCWFKDAQGKPLRTKDGKPVLATRVCSLGASPLAPGSEAVQFTVPEWADPAWLAKNGIPHEGGLPVVDVKLVGARIKRE